MSRYFHEFSLLVYAYQFWENKRASKVVDAAASWCCSIFWMNPSGLTDCLICKHLSCIFRYPGLSFSLCMNNFITLLFFQFFKDKYVQREAMRERMRHYTVITPPFMNHPHPPLPFAPIYPPGFVGGDYDRDPPGFPQGRDWFVWAWPQC